MIWRLAADAAVLLHVTFVVFVVLGGFLVWRYPRVAWLHLPAAVWGFWVEACGWICPLTSLENACRWRAGEAGYQGGFLEHYLMPILYPVGLTRHSQIWLAVAVLGINGWVYIALWRRRKKNRRKVGSENSNA